VIGLDSWSDEPEYAAAQDTFTQRGTLILSKLRQLNFANLNYVLDDLYPKNPPDPMDITKTEGSFCAT
jgi:hypothetical protein